MQSFVHCHMFSNSEYLCFIIEGNCFVLSENFEARGQGQ